MFKYNTKVNNANANSKTLRTSIPKEITALLDLKRGDKLSWNVDILDNENFRIFLEKK